MKSNANSILIKQLAAKPVAFNPELARIAGSAIAGLFMSQLLYWWGKGRNKDCVYKTIKEFKSETCLTRSEQNRAIKIWKNLEVLEVRNKGIPQTRHFYIDQDRLIKLLGKRAKSRGIDGYYIDRDKQNDKLVC
ncbi:MAG: hypothetical protein WA055_04780 [Candidatus Moraniibacteriota bacterium]